MFCNLYWTVVLGTTGGCGCEIWCADTGTGGTVCLGMAEEEEDPAVTVTGTAAATGVPPDPTRGSGWY